MLASSLAQYTYPEAIGAFIIAALGLIALGWSGLFGRVIDLVPRPVIAGMLAGVLVRFGLGVFRALPTDPLLVGVMLVTYLVLRRFKVRAPSIGTLVAGLVVAALAGQLHFAGFSLALTTPVLTWPAFSLRRAVRLEHPTLHSGQCLTKCAWFGSAALLWVSTASGWADSDHGRPLALHRTIWWAGVSLAAITAALCAGPEAHPDPDRRYAAGVAYGFWYILIGVFGATAVSLFTGLPSALVATVAGLALTGAPATALTNAMVEPAERDGALLCLFGHGSGHHLAGHRRPVLGIGRRGGGELGVE